MKYIPNLITSIRILFSALLLFVKPFSQCFYIAYFICGLSDVLDGYIARKTNTSSKFGATLDSIADTVFIVIILFLFLPIVKISLPALWWIAGITCIRLVSVIIGYRKYHGFAFLHTYANKATGLALFFIPLIYTLIDKDASAYIICALASYSSIEELAINITSKTLNCDVKSIFTKLKE